MQSKIIRASSGMGLVRSLIGRTVTVMSEEVLLQCVVKCNIYEAGDFGRRLVFCFTCCVEMLVTVPQLNGSLI